MLTSGQRLGPDQETRGLDGAVLRYQNDGNLVLYGPAGPRWATGTSGVPGYVEMQADGNLVVYDGGGAPVWATNTHAPGAVLEVRLTGLRILVLEAVWSTPELEPLPEPGPGPTPPGEAPVRPLVGIVRPLGRGVKDDTGPRVAHGCSDFAALVKFHENRDGYLAQLDIAARYQQYTRVLWRLNGWPWTPSGLTVDPIRDPWWESALRGVLAAHRDRGMRVNLSSGDFNNWTTGQALDTFRRLGQIAADYPGTVWLSAVVNEMANTWRPGDENDDQIAIMAECLEEYRRGDPLALLAGSDPASRDGHGMRRLAPHPANALLIHDVRWTIADALRRAFNSQYENNKPPSMTLAQDEPTGPNDPAPPGPFNRKVYQPIEDPRELFALYTMHVVSGAVSTYFNDPALVSRRPLDETWGFKELPLAWRQMGVPENLGEGRLLHGGLPDAPLLVNGSNASRADSVQSADGRYCLGVISGREAPGAWRVKSGRDGVAAWIGIDGRPLWEARVRHGEVLPIDSDVPAVVRIVS